jgi:hypothetical protein
MEENYLLLAAYGLLPAASWSWLPGLGPALGVGADADGRTELPAACSTQQAALGNLSLALA